MKKLLLFTILFSICSHAHSQSIEDQVKALRLNASPAYVVLGVEPENIQRPNSPSDFLACVQSAVVNDRLQPNFAMETSPYYWGRKKTNRKRFDVYEYILGNNYGENLARSITLSLATSATDNTVFGNIPAGTGLGIGIHMQLVQGKVSSKVKTNLLNWYRTTRMQNILNLMVQALDDGRNIDNLDAWMDKVFTTGNNKYISEEEKKLFRSLLGNELQKNAFSGADLNTVRSFRDKLEKEAENDLEHVNEYQFPLTREGFMLELAVANASVASDSKWDQLKSARTAIWLTPSYRFNVNKDPEIIDFVDLMAVVRMTFNSKEADSSHYVDAGGKIQWTHNRLSFSGEAIYRFLSKKPETQLKNHTFRTAFTFSYKMNELVTFQATFGSNFDGNSTTYSDPRKMFAVGGFNFGFSNFKPQQKD